MCAAENIIENVYCSLSDKQSESIFYLNSDDFRPLPQKPRSRFESEQLPQTGEETVEIELASQFYSWLGSSSHTDYSEFIQSETELLSNFENQEKYCTAIINKTDEILSILNELKEKYHSVSDKTNNLHETCENLLRKQTDLNEKADQIEEYLQSFNALFSIESKLSNKNLVLSAERMDEVLKSIDQSIVFLNEHRTFKDSEAFLARFINCLNIALLMVKEGIKNSIRQVVLEIVELGDAISPENSFILLYGRFRAQASRIRSLMELMESRADTSEKYCDVITECQAYYLSKREALVLPVARASIADLTSKYSRDHCELFRTTISFMLHMVEDESLLFWRFFQSQKTSTQTMRSPLSLETMLTNLCNCVYDALRPFLVHVNHIEILTELCDLLIQEFIEDKATANRNVDLSAFENMCQTLLADVQQRLIYRAHIYIKSQIQDYQPGPGDIAYPEKLEMLESITSNLQQQQQSQIDKSESASVVQERVSSTDSTDFHGMWYPTVRRALVCISGLSRCLDVESFQGLAQNCLSSCIDSLLLAQKRIETRRTPSDGQLFFIKHLLILREQVTPFNVDFRVRETTLDFSNITNAAYQVLPKAGSKLFDLSKANHLLRLLLLEGPTVIDNDVDSRRQLDRQLKYTCELFISDSIRALTEQLSLLLEKAKLASSNDSAQPLGPPNEIKEAVSASFRQLSFNQQETNLSPNTLAAIRRKLALYLGNANTVAIIMRPIENGVVQTWRKFGAVIGAHYSEEDRMVIGCPKENQIRLLFHN
nr:oligomeric golgi complex subunit 3 [Hymenolepis microstoma]